MKDKKNKNTNPIDNFYFGHWKKSELKIFAEKNNIQLPKKIKLDEIIEIIKQNLPNNIEEIYIIYPAIDIFIKNSIKELKSKRLASILFGISIILYSILLFFLFLWQKFPLYAKLYIELYKLIPYLIVFYIFLIFFWIFIKILSFKDEDKIYSELRAYCNNNILIKNERTFLAFHNFGWIPRLSKWINNEDFREVFQFIFILAWVLYVFFIMSFFPQFIFIILGIISILFYIEMYNNAKRDILEGYVSYSFKMLNREILAFINIYDQKEEKTSLENVIFTFINDINDLLNLNIFGRASEGVEAWNISHNQSNLSIIHNLTYKFERFIQYLLINEKIQLESNKVKNLNNLIKSLRDELEFEINKFPKIPKTKIIGGTLSFTSALLYIIWMLINLTNFLSK